nr:VanZ family protein [Lachnospiraceae bacterium]
LCRILAPLMMLVIFYFSSRPGPESDVDSMAIGRIIGEMVVPDFEDMELQAQLEFVTNINHAVRKTAHFTEYAVLAVLLAGALDAEDKKRRAIFLQAVAIAALYAASDEFHQTFVPGRAGKISDVLIDSAGAVAGAAIVIALRRRISVIK